MAEKKKKLNKGLDAIFGGDITSLIDDIENNTPESSQEKIHLDEIRPNPYQPRKVFDEQALNELALSIKEHGIFQPVILKKSVQGYEIVAGERRCRAAKIAELDEVPAIIVDFTDQQMMEIALLENIQREDLSPLEEAKAYQALIKEYDYNQTELAEIVGKKQSTIANKLRLLKLSLEDRKKIVEAGLTERHARALLRIPNQAMRSKVLDTIITNGYNVQRTDAYIEQLLTLKEAEAKPKSKGKRTFIVKDIRIFMNTINHAIETMKLSGIHAVTHKCETEDYIECIVRIPKAKSSTAAS